MPHVDRPDQRVRWSASTPTGRGRLQHVAGGVVLVSLPGPRACQTAAGSSAPESGSGSGVEVIVGPTLPSATDSRRPRIPLSPQGLRKSLQKPFRPGRAGSGPRVGCGGLDRLDQRVGRSRRGAAVVSTGSTSGWAGPGAGCGGLDRLDQRVGRSRRGAAVVSTGSTSGWAGPSAGLRWSRQARPAGGPVPARAAVVSTGSTGGWAGPGAGLRWSRLARPAGGPVPARGCGGLDRLDQRVGRSRPRLRWSRESPWVL